MAETSFEYWVKDKDGEFYFLTENQKNYLMENQDKRFIEFPHCTINPAYIVSITKHTIEKLKDLYPCKRCMTNGYLIGQPRDDDGKYPECPDCKGEGIQLP